MQNKLLIIYFVNNYYYLNGDWGLGPIPNPQSPNKFT